MLVKRYQAADMQAAMDTIIKELGSDAVVLDSKKVRPKGLAHLFTKPLVEVMVAYDPGKTPAALRKAAYQGQGVGLPPERPRREPPAPVREAAGGAAQNGEQLQELDRRISSLDRMLGDFMDKFSYVKRDITYDYAPEVQALVGKLVENQVREELAHALARETEAILRTQPESPPREVMEHLLLELLGQPEPISPKKFKRKVILLVGPTGVGKTTTLVKLAANFSVKQKKRVGIINTDTFRIAAQEQIKTYADILSIPLAVAYQKSELAEALASMEDLEVVFIDTAGKKPGDVQHQEDIGGIIAVANPEDVLLCVSAATGFAPLKEVVDTYAFIEDFRLLVTKLDETRYRGGILNLRWYAKKNLAYVTTGQNVPDDIEKIDIQSIVDELLR
ncbi:MAG: flagellar biosynthesis protein FlhF [Clostridiales bacterium]|nr:flagellar biosynthesis protein FlhF [Clostridiales bacterium]